MLLLNMGRMIDMLFLMLPGPQVLGSNNGFSGIDLFEWKVLDEIIGLYLKYHCFGKRREECNYMKLELLWKIRDIWLL